MIARLRGEVIAKTQREAVIDVNGVGYEVAMAEHDLENCPLNQEVTLYTHLSIRENAHELFGFTTQQAKDLYEKLVSVSGVGPKIALNILNLGEPENIRSAIASGNTAYVSSASGIGKRGAEKIIVELKEKVGLPSVDTSMTQPAQDDDAYDALLALGYSAQQAGQALARVDTDLDSQQRIKAALKELS